MNTAVAYFVFNRPRLVARTFPAIRAARPKKLFVVCDGPRPGRAEEAAKVRAVREIIAGDIDWPCEVYHNYSDTNLGCRNRVASGLNWVFSQVEEAIVLEDDCLPSQAFFTFCEAMLERYRNDERVVHIGGCNISAPYGRSRASYRFTRHAWIWGWATWRRVWEKYDFNMTTWDQRMATTRSTFSNSWEAQYWLSTFDQCRQDLEKANTWGFPWMYTCRALDGLCLLPTHNLVENIGFNGESTHPFRNAERLAVPADALNEIRHPESTAVDGYEDDLLTRVYADAELSFRANLKARARILREHLRPSG